MDRDDKIRKSPITQGVVAVGRWCWVTLNSLPGRSTKWARASCAWNMYGWGSFGYFSLAGHFVSVSLSMGDGLMKSEVLSEKAGKPKTTMQPTNHTWYIFIEHASSNANAIVNRRLRQFSHMYTRSKSRAA